MVRTRNLCLCWRAIMTATCNTNKMLRVLFAILMYFVGDILCYKPVFLLHGVLTGNASMVSIEARIREVGIVTKPYLHNFYLIKIIYIETSGNSSVLYRSLQRMVKPRNDVAPGPGVRQRHHEHFQRPPRRHPSLGVLTGRTYSSRNIGDVP